MFKYSNKPHKVQDVEDNEQGDQIEADDKLPEWNTKKLYIILMSDNWLLQYLW